MSREFNTSASSSRNSLNIGIVDLGGLYNYVAYDKPIC